MNSKIPLTVAVVGALLIGGATTGTTRASWAGQAQLHSSSISSGQMSYTATSPAGVTVDKVAGSTADTTFVLDDTSQGKNLTQRITASVATATLPAGMTATIGDTCPAAGTSVFVDTTPTSNQTLCVRVTSSTTAVSGNVTINLSSAQRPTAGWTTPIITRTVEVTVNQTTPAPAAPVDFRCTGFENNNQVKLAWNAVSPAPLEYRVYRTGSPIFVASSGTTLTVDRGTWGIANGVATPFVVKAFTTAGGESVASNTVTVTFGNSRSCSPLAAS